MHLSNYLNKMKQEIKQFEDETIQKKDQIIVLKVHL
jgi:hypothetical protein